MEEKQRRVSINGSDIVIVAYLIFVYKLFRRIT